MMLKWHLGMPKWDFVQNNKCTSAVSSHSSLILFVWIFCIMVAFLRRQNSMVHNSRKNTEQFLA